jgi:hypothetical protein
MFSDQFFPTPLSVIERMVEGIDLHGKIAYEPQAGKGDIVDYCLEHGADVIASELHKDLRKIVASKCKVIAEDCLTVTSDQISHVQVILSNPPFNEAMKHILHLFEIAPPGCIIRALCNSSNLENTYTKERKQVNSLIESYGDSLNLGNVFKQSERYTEVETTLIRLQKPGESYSQEFEGFFLEADEEEPQENGIMSYNVVRDLVNRYVAAVKLFDEQLSIGAKMNSLLSGFYGESLAFSCTENGKPKLRNDFKKDLQKAGWNFIFQKMNMQKYATKGLREDINKFVEQQTNIPFTMKNIYKMLEIVVGTNASRMDKAILEVFDRVTERHAENRHNVKGWKTNSHFVVGKKFILDYMISPAKEYGYTSTYYTSLRSSYDGIIPDFEKALCFVTGTNYDEISGVNDSINRNTYGEWYESHFFRYKGYKNGNMHFEFKDEDVWHRFNQRIAKIKGYPLFEGKKQTKYQERQTGRADQVKERFAYTKSQTIF